MENRNSLIVDCELAPASGTAERTAAVDRVWQLPGSHGVTVGADRAHDTADFIDELRCQNATAHVLQNTMNRSAAIDARTTYGVHGQPSASASGLRRPSAGARPWPRCVK